MFDHRIETGQVCQTREAFDPDLLARLVLDFRYAIGRQQDAVTGLQGEL